MSDKDKPSTPPDAHASFHAGNELLDPQESKETTEISALRAELANAKSETQSIMDRFVRKEAELQNMERICRKDVADARKFAIESIAKELLTVLDSFEQGLMYEKDNEKLTDGLQLTYSLLLEILAKFGIKEISLAVNDPFDPKNHEALSMQETADMEPNKIVAIIQKGYLIHERILRPVRVVVSRALAV